MYYFPPQLIDEPRLNQHLGCHVPIPHGDPWASNRRRHSAQGAQDLAVPRSQAFNRVKVDRETMNAAFAANANVTVHDAGGVIVDSSLPLRTLIASMCPEVRPRRDAYPCSGVAFLRYACQRGHKIPASLAGCAARRLAHAVRSQPCLLYRNYIRT